MTERTLNLRSQLGARIRSVRNNAQLTLDDVSQQTGLSPRVLGAMELGERPIPGEWLPEIARICGVTSAHLLGEQRHTLDSAA